LEEMGICISILLVFKELLEEETLGRTKIPHLRSLVIHNCPICLPALSLGDMPLATTLMAGLMALGNLEWLTSAHPFPFFLQHLQQHESGVEGESCYYHCVLCNYSTKAKLNLIQHVRSMKHQRSESLRKLQRLQKGLPEEDEDLGQIFTIRRCPSTDPGEVSPGCGRPGWAWSLASTRPPEVICWGPLYLCNFTWASYLMLDWFLPNILLNVLFFKESHPTLYQAYAQP
jgi:hypothetical protein